MRVIYRFKIENVRYIDSNIRKLVQLRLASLTTVEFNYYFTIVWFNVKNPLNSIIIY